MKKKAKIETVKPSKEQLDQMIAAIAVSDAAPEHKKAAIDALVKAATE